MKKFSLSLLLLLSTLFLFAQGGGLQFQGTSYPAPVATGKGYVEIIVTGLTAPMYPMTMTITPDGTQQPVITVAGIQTATTDIWNVPVGLFHFKMTTNTGAMLLGDSEVGVLMPDNRVVYKTTIVKYPDPK